VVLLYRNFALGLYQTKTLSYSMNGAKVLPPFKISRKSLWQINK
jgi:hypothetical protein